MRDHLNRLTALAVALAVAALAASIADPVAAAASSHQGRKTTGAAPLAGRTAPATGRGAPVASLANSGPAPATALARPLLLITGDRVWAGTASGGVRVTGFQPAASGFSYQLIFINCARPAAVPTDALPYLGRGLDASLFDLSALRKAEANGQLPVTVSYHGRLPALPGVTITKPGHGTAQGYLTPASARAFGAALHRQFLADHSSGRYGSTGMFAGGVSIALAGSQTTRAPRARPAFPMHTLIVDGTSLAGKPDTGDLAVVFNTDNCLLLGDPGSSVNPFFHGQTRFSVPSGHYLAMGLFSTHSGGRLAFLKRLTVRGDTTIHVREPGGGTKITMVTPRPAVARDSNFALIVRQRSGSWLGIDAYSNGAPLWVTGVRAGRLRAAGLHAYTAEDLFSPGSPARYVYHVAIADPPGTIPRQHFTVHASSLATVTDRYYQDVKSTGGWFMGGAYPLPFRVIGVGITPFPVRLPTSLVHYVTAGRHLDWLAAYWQFPSGTGGQSDSLRTFAPGQRVTVDWNRYPLHAATNVNPIGRRSAFPSLPSASRAGDALTIDVTAFTDNTPGHFGAGFCPYASARVTGSYQIDQNGVKIAGGSPPGRGLYCDLFATARLSGQPSVVRLVVAARRTGGPARLSTASRTTWTWRSRRQPGATVPPGWSCRGRGRHCAVQPMMTLRYALRGLSPADTTKPGRQVLGLAVGHIQPAAATRVTGASVAVSVDGGRTWRPAAVTRTGAGRFRATFTAPAGAYVTLRTHAADASGGSMTETLTRAYRVAASPGRPGEPRPAAGPRLRAACPAARPGQFRCLALFRPQPEVNAAIAAGRHGRAATPGGLTAKQIESAYKLPVTTSPHQTVAVVEAYSTPHLAHFLAVYRHQFGLPACTVGGGCLRIVNQRGEPSPLPRSGVPFGWDVETSLDVSMVSAACPLCHILVVEGNGASFGDLAAAENTAARLGAAAISNSYGVNEYGLPLRFAKAYDHPGHAIVVSSGDSGFTAASYPADLATVTAAGGTELAPAHNSRGWTERVWNKGGGASGSGCSSYVPKPAWQHDPHCGMRTTADVAAVAWNLAVYDSYQGGWLTVAGTSASSPLIAGVYGLAGNAAHITPGYPYAHAASLFDITQGNNDFYHQAHGATCGYDYLCVARPGYDAPTGLGTPDGTGAF